MKLKLITSRSAQAYLLSVVCFALGASQAFAACDTSGNPVQINSSCEDLAINNTVTGVTIGSAATVTPFFSTNVVTIGAPGNVTGTFLNQGTISSGFYYNALVNQGVIGTLLNQGTIGAVAGGHNGLVNSGSIGTLTNQGTITNAQSSSTTYAALNNGGQIGTINNSGTISGTAGLYGHGAFALYQSGQIGTINNTGTISAQNRAINFAQGISANIDVLNNSGKIEGGVNGGGTSTFASAIVLGAANTIGTITNTGTIDHSVCDAGGTCYAAIENQGGSIGTITNLGALTSGNTGSSGYGIINGITGSISTLNNAQGDLKYYGKLPTNYNVIINPTSYGQMAVTNSSSTTNFGIYPGASFTIGNNVVYSRVLSGVTMANISSGTSGTYGGGLFRTNWTLATNASNPSQLDLTATTAAVTPNVPGQSGSALASVIQSSSTAATATTLANGTTLAGAAQSLTQQQTSQLSSVHAEGYSSNMTIGLEQMAHITNTVMDRIHNPLSARGGTSTAYEMDQGKYVWADAAAVKGTVNSYAGLDGFGYNLYDMILGADLYRTASGGIGVYGGAGYTTMTEPAQVTQNFNTTNYYAGLYGGKYLPYNFKLSGALGYMYGNTNASRNNPNVGLFTGGMANSNYNTNGAYGAFKFSRPFQASQNLTLTPYIGASHSQLWMGQARESGGNDFNYTISNATAYTTVTFVGGEFIMPLTGAVKNPLSAVGFYRFGYDWFANSGYAHSVTANSPIFGSFNQIGADMGPALNLMGLGLQGYITQKVSARAGVVGSANTNGWQVGVGGELKWEL